MMTVRAALYARTGAQTTCDIPIGIHDCILYNQIMSAMEALAFQSSVEDLVRIPLPGIGLFKVPALNYGPDPVPEQQHPLELILLAMEDRIQLILNFQCLKSRRRQILERRKCGVGPVRRAVRMTN